MYRIQNSPGFFCRNRSDICSLPKIGKIGHSGVGGAKKGRSGRYVYQFSSIWQNCKRKEKNIVNFQEI